MFTAALLTQVYQLNSTLLLSALVTLSFPQDSNDGVSITAELLVKEKKYNLDTRI